MIQRHIRLTKGQRNVINRFDVGVGLMAWKNQEGEITQCEFYTDQDGNPCRASNGSSILPLPPSRKSDGFPHEDTEDDAGEEYTQ
jgi:hypothetical protein